MTRKLMFTLMLLTCIIAVTPKANAQQTKVNVPYNFLAAGKLFHAGTYTFTREPSEGALRFDNIDRKGSGTLISSNTFEPALSDGTTLQFKRMGDLYILHAIQTPWARYTFTLGSKAARLALKQLAASSAGQ